ncbi:hypothetical protein C5E20_08525 [Pectobacterium parmentieri]|uniref:hypothetical protein n=1 Tax=Pectobacterium parmentieri TaxID=1905730 RepID=UPI000EB4B0C4|nr:hypothetical protein [Pectobacterium parmentieri]AYH27174.1 hypothetical protein C5E20_08525 [Pectobacterium parmentieri]
MRVLIFILLFVSSMASADELSCSIKDISVKEFNAKFVDGHGKDKYLKGAATVINNCNVPIGIEMKLSAIDKRGNVVDVYDFWPASVNNISTGEYDFSLNGRIKYSEEIKSFKLIPISVNSW